jgi:small subunit ribosomal protein S6
MRPYETMIVLDVAVDAQLQKAALDRALAAITTTGGRIVGEPDRWGKRPLAYEIKKRKEGSYVVVQFEGVPATVAELDRILGLSDEVLRHKVVRVPAHRPVAKVAPQA